LGSGAVLMILAAVWQGLVWGANDDYSQWTYSRNIILNTTSSGANVATDQTNFPVLIRLTNANFPFFQAQSSGQDIRFSNSGGTHIPYQTERWDYANQVAEIWVNSVVLLGNNNTQYITMYWGNATAADSAMGNAVFNTANGFIGVYHLNEGGMGTRYNSAQSLYNGTPMNYDGTESTFGDIAKGDSLKVAAGSDGINLGTGIAPTTAITLSAWVKPHTYFTWGKILNEAYAGSNLAPYEIFSLMDDGTGKVQFALDLNNAETKATATSPTPLDQWSYVAGTYDMSAERMFFNGTQQGANVSTFSIGNSTQPATIGYNCNADEMAQRYNGVIDEVRIENVARSADWIKLCYQNQQPGGDALCMFTPPTPTGLSVTAITGTTATLSWSPSQGATSYNLQVSVNSDFSSPILNVTGLTGNSDPMSGLTPGATYYWRESATNANGTSGWGIPIPATFVAVSAGWKHWNGTAANGYWTNPSNWTGGAVPSNTDTAIFDNTSIANCTLTTVTSNVKSIVFTNGYTGTFNFNNKALAIFGDADFRSGGTFARGGLDSIIINATGAANFFPKTGVRFPEIYFGNSAGTALVRQGALSTGKIHIASGSVIMDTSFATDTILVDGSASIDFGTRPGVFDSVGMYIGGLGGGTINFDSPNLCFKGQTLNLSGFTTVFQSAAGVLQFIGATAQTFIPKSGYPLNSIQQIGAGGTTLSTNNLSCNTLQVTSGPFNLSSLADTTTSLIINGGTLDASTGSLYVNGDVTLSSGTLTAPSSGNFFVAGNWTKTGGSFNHSNGTIRFTATTPGKTIDAGGSSFYQIYFGNTAGGGWTLLTNLTSTGGVYANVGTLNLGTGLTHSVGFLGCGNGGSVNFGSSTLRIVSGLANFGMLTSVIPSSGTLEFAASTGTQVFTPLPGATFPPVIHSGMATLQLSTNSVTCASFSNPGGPLDFNGQNMATAANGGFTITNGNSSTMVNLGGRTITTSGTGSVNLSGESGNYLDLNPTATWYVNASGSLNAAYATIKNSNASGSSGWGVPVNCADSGGNTKWDFSPPASTVTVPANGSYQSSLAVLSGTANDAGSGVSYVKVSIRNQTDNLYWTGTAWSGAQMWLAATGTTSWTYTAPAWTSGKTYLIQSEATDNAGNIETPGAGNSFTFDNVPPASSVTFPVNASYQNSLVTLAGAASDAGSGVSGVKVSIKNQTDNLYWTGTAWSGAQMWFTASGTTSWTYASPAWTSGKTYLIQSEAVDNAGNVEMPGSGNTFTFDNVAPTSYVIAPANGSYQISLAAITGSAVDAGSGVSSVKVSIKRRTDNLYWTGTAWSGAQIWLAATGVTAWMFDASSVLWTSDSFTIQTKATDMAANEETPGAGVSFHICTPPVVTANPANQSVTAGYAATFTVAAAGPGISLQWQRSDDGGYTWYNMSGDTNSTYSFTVAQGDSGSQYMCEVYNSCDIVYSNPALLSVCAPPLITAQSSTQSIAAGQNAVFSVTAVGIGLSYQWQRSNDAGVNWSSISDAIASSYGFATAIGDNGAQFRCAIANPCGMVTSNTTTLTVGTVPVVSVNPRDTAVVSGAMATFAVTATGTLPLTYLWQKNGTVITGATGASYSTPAVSMADSGSLFKCVVSNAYGSVTSAAGMLRVVTVPAITLNPKDSMVLSGAAAGFSVSATGTPPLSYQWQKNGANITGATSATYVTPAAAVADSGSIYKCIASNAWGSATSTSALLRVVSIPVVTLNPRDTAVIPGATAAFLAAATGTPPLAYQWQKNGVSITGATASSCTTPAVTTADSGSLYKCIVTNAYGKDTSVAAVLLIVTKAKVAGGPRDTAVVVGTVALFAVSAGGMSPLAYQWQKNGISITGATGASYTTPATTGADSGSLFRCIVSNAYGADTSTAAKLSVVTKAKVTVQPRDTTVVPTSAVSFMVAASGTPPLTYQWILNEGIIAGAQSPTYALPSESNADNGNQYRCIVSNAWGRDTSAAATLHVYAPVHAAFGASPLAGAAPLAVAFVDSSSGTVTARRWNFGDNGTDTGRTPHHAYAIAGAYSVKLWVAGPAGADSVLHVKYITVSDTTPPMNNLRVTLIGVGDSAVSVAWKVDTTQKDAAAVFAGLALAGVPSADSTRYPYRDTAFVVRNTKTPGVWRLSYLLADSNGNRSPALFDTVTIANTPPRFMRTISILNATDDTLWADSVFAFDLNADPVRYSVAEGPAALVLDSVSGRISWRPEYANVGTPVIVAASDGRGGVAFDTARITVAHVNHPPRITYAGDSTVHEDSLLRAAVAITDPDQGDSAFVAGTTLPAWMTLTGDSLFGKPKPGDAGKASVLIIVSDKSGLRDTLVKTLTVLFTNHPPTLLAWTAPDSVRMNSTYSGRFQVQDIDKNDSVIVSWGIHPPWLGVQQVADSASMRTFVLSGTPAAANVGIAPYSLAIADKNGASFTITKSIFVVKVNMPPVAVIRRDRTVVRAGAARYVVSATDDQDTTFTFNSALRLLDDSTFTKTVTVSNAAGATVDFFPLTDGRYEFSVAAVDHQGAISVSPPRDTFSVAGASRHEFDGDTQWQMISIPSRPIAINQIAGTGYMLHWDEGFAEVPIYGYYRRADELVQTAAGLSYWRKSPDTVRVSLTRDNVLDSAIRLRLSKDACGWNQIASPYVYPVAWTFTSTAWKWNPVTRDFEDAGGTLNPWEGYWVQTDSAATVLFDNTPGFSASTLSKRFAAKWSSAGEWQVRVIFANSVNTDAQNILGLSSSAKDGYSACDAAEPPRINNDQHLYFYHPEWKRAITEYARDIRRTLSDPTIFPMGISAGGGAENGRITFEGVENCTGVYFFLADAKSITQVAAAQPYPIEKSDKVVYKTLFVTRDKDFLKRYPRTFELAAPYPNPARQIANVKYTLPYRFGANGEFSPAPYTVNLALYDASGRTVRQLVYSSKNPGQYSALWDGKNNSGLYVSAGIYFLRLEAGELSGTKRIIIVK
jgi:hypothetical protein